MHLDDEAFLGFDEEIVADIFLNDDFIVAFILTFLVVFGLGVSDELEIEGVVCVVNALDHEEELLPGLDVEEGDTSMVLVDLFTLNIIVPGILPVPDHKSLA